MDYPPRPPPGMIPGYHPHPPPAFMMPPQRPPYAAQADPRLGPPHSNMGPPVTVFVGNITEKAQDAMIRHLLNTCGPVNSWKRVQGATGKLQAFGFCEFGNPDAALRAIRILHDWEIADKKLVVKVDAKTKDVLDDFKRKKRKALLGEEKDAKADQGNVTESEYVDSTMKKEDDLTRERIRSIIKEHSKDMNAYINDKRSSRSRSDHDGETRLTGPKESLDDVELEDGKRDIIHREIDKFRETMKIREAEKEAEKQKREKDKRPRSRDRDRGDRNNDRNDRSDRNDRNDREKKRRTRSRSASPLEKRSSRSASRRVSRSRSRSRERRSRSRRDSPIRERRDPKDVRRERELEEEEKERKRAERKARDKEASYQERLRKWEAREQKMARQYENDRLKEVRKKEDEEREAKKLREFLEDYDDDRDDDKYYKGILNFPMIFQYFFQFFSILMQCRNIMGKF